MKKKFKPKERDGGRRVKKDGGREKKVKKMEKDGEKS